MKTTTMAQQIAIVYNPLIENTNNTYKVLATQMGKILDVFGAPKEDNKGPTEK